MIVIVVAVAVVAVVDILGVVMLMRSKQATITPATTGANAGASSTEMAVVQARLVPAQQVQAVASTSMPSSSTLPFAPRFDVNTGQQIPKFDPETGKQNWA